MFEVVVPWFGLADRVVRAGCGYKKALLLSGGVSMCAHANRLDSFDANMAGNQPGRVHALSTFLRSRQQD